MLRSLDGLEGSKIVASDGEIGWVRDLLFDDEGWAIRYLVVDTGPIGGRRVLVSPMAVEQADAALREIRVSLTVNQVERSPSMEVEAPLRRQQERELSDHFGWPYYWGLGGLWGTYSAPAPLWAAGRTAPTGKEAEAGDEEKGHSHLHSVREVTGYHLQASDGEIGHVEDFLFDDESWAIRYLVVDTRNWWFGRKVLLSPDWSDQVSWSDRKVLVNPTREQIRNAPEWSADSLLDREYETRLHQAHGRRGYWEKEPQEDRELGPHQFL